MLNGEVVILSTPVDADLSAQVRLCAHHGKP